MIPLYCQFTLNLSLYLKSALSAHVLYVYKTSHSRLIGLIHITPIVYISDICLAGELRASGYKHLPAQV